MKIAEIMTRSVETCRPQDTLDMAAQKMWEQDCGILPIVDETGRLAGVITDRDICMAAWTKGRSLDAIRVDQAMSRQVYAAAPDDDLELAERTMAEKQIRRLPIIDASARPIGMLSMSDIARKGTTAQVAGDGLARAMWTLAAICQPRMLAPPRAG